MVIYKVYVSWRKCSEGLLFWNLGTIWSKNLAGMFVVWSGIHFVFIRNPRLPLPLDPRFWVGAVLLNLKFSEQYFVTIVCIFVFYLLALFVCCSNYSFWLSLWYLQIDLSIWENIIKKILWKSTKLVGFIILFWIDIFDVLL